MRSAGNGARGADSSWTDSDGRAEDDSDGLGQAAHCRTTPVCPGRAGPGLCGVWTPARSEAALCGASPSESRPACRVIIVIMVHSGPLSARPDPPRTRPS